MSERISEYSATLGSNQIAVREFNERIVLRVIRKHGGLSKTEISRITNLSTQTASIIINALIRKKLLVRQPRIKGKIGQPAIPISLNKVGAFSIGIHIGRKSLECMLVNLKGDKLESDVFPYEYPDPDVIFPVIQDRCQRFTQSLDPKLQDRIIGIGLAAPLEIHGWIPEMRIPEQIVCKWMQINIPGHVREMCGLPVFFAKDTSAACIAENELGLGNSYSSFFYFFIGEFIGGGHVLNGFIDLGRLGNSAAIGSLPVRYRASGDTDEPLQLIHLASKYLLDSSLKKNSPQASLPETENDTDKNTADIISAWIEQTSDALAYAVICSITVHDYEAIVIDGSLPGYIIRRIVQKTKHKISGYNLQGLTLPDVCAGLAGKTARTYGAAIMPFYANFSANPSLLIKDRINDDYLKNKILVRHNVKIYN